MFQRGISKNDVLKALTKCEIIEQYPTDYPFPSCLILGNTIAGCPLHVVCGSAEAELWLITAYFPSPIEWTEDYKSRRNV
jgi:hypothetical protein